MRRWRQPGLERVLIPAGVSAVLALAVLAPLLRRGFTLSYDMVFAPRQYLLPDSLGLGSALPRSVPADAVIALATHVVPGDLVQKLLLFLALAGGALGAGRLVPSESLATKLIATVSYGWTAYVAERLLIGHWPYLLSYACLPWIAAAGLALRRRAPRSIPALVLASAPACLTPTGGILAAATGITAAGARRLAITVPVAVLLNAPWWVPSVLHPGGSASAAEGVTAFSARTESWGTPVLSLLGLGGIWNADTTPASRSNPLVPVLTLLTVAIALFGLRALAARWGIAPTRALVLLGAFGVLLGALGSLPLGADLLTWMVREIPGGGLLRDGQKWVAWWALPLALGFALGVERLAGSRTATDRQAAAPRRGPTERRAAGPRRAILIAAVLLPVAMLPDLAWAGFGRLGTASYPADWLTVRGIIVDDPRPGDVLTFPLSPFRRFAWNAGRTQLDPAPRVLSRTTVVDDTLSVDRRTIPGEDERSRRIRGSLNDLGGQGIGWVLVEKGTPGRTDLPALERIFDGEWLTLYRVPGPISPDSYPTAPRAPVLAADIAALALIALCLLWSALPASRFAEFTRSGKE
jgi:hypothetical protein